MSKVYVSPKLSVGHMGTRFRRADIQIHGLEHAGPTFEGRVFLNRADATKDTPRDAAHGYAGSFHVFGHGGCWGDVGHCEVHERRAYDPRPSHPLAPMTKHVIATQALLRLLSAGATEITVTIVPVILSSSMHVDTGDVVHFERLRVVAYQ
jgi:tyrosinase